MRRSSTPNALIFPPLPSGQVYKGAQQVRVRSEQWFKQWAFCPNCGAPELAQLPNNSPVRDFVCRVCGAQYELKSKGGLWGAKIVDGAYHTMMTRLTAFDSPHLCLVSYRPELFRVEQALVVPKYFFQPALIEARRPLAATARRAGWVGCNIRLHEIPQMGKIWLVRDGQAVPKRKVMMQWRQSCFLATESNVVRRGWLLDMMQLIERLDRAEFSLREIYTFVDEMRLRHPHNQHVEDKMRQQLQRLRDLGYLEFTRRGCYRLVRFSGMAT